MAKKNKPKADSLQGQESPAYCIAVGASAGGLEALLEFFQAMPADSGAAFIVIQHLSPDFKSVMADLLGRGTKMEVVNASDGLEVTANKVYLIQPRKNMMMAEGKLLLVDQMPEKSVNFPIDIFFRSLAEDQHHRSIGIILSGTGSDGSRGIQAIKEVGGLVLVQEPTTAKFDGMPYNAVKTGFADVVIGPKEMPATLIKYMTHPMISGKGRSLAQYIQENNIQFNDPSLKEIFELLKQRSDIDFTQYKPSTVARRIERRIGIHQLESVAEYYHLLSNSPQELQTLAKDLLIGVTRFFRDTDCFDLLREKVIPKIIEEVPREEPIRVWVVGCSSGEEAYSLAIIFDQYLREIGESRNVKIFATDVDQDAIVEASSGQFALNIKDDILDEDILKRYFRLDNDHYTIIPQIRQMVVFAVHNLIKDPPFSNIHLATCRNVLIYFQHEAQKRVLSLLHFALRKGYYLCLGPSETLGEALNYFDVIDERWRIFQKTIGARIKDSNTTVGGLTSEKVPPVPELMRIMRNYKGIEKAAPSTVVTDALLKAYVPPAVVLNDSFEAVHVYGDISHYTSRIKAGRFSSNIKDIIRADLSIALSTALHRAKSNKEDVYYEKVQFENPEKEGGVETINLKIRYLKDAGQGLAHYIVIFETPLMLSPDSIEDTASITFNYQDQSQQRIRDLEEELQKKQEHLQVTVEELETTNEELQSSNEELLAANEELQSTNEELQSVNEELYTVNSEYQEKIEELTQINLDMDNLLKSSTVGIIFLDESMLIRNFTAAVVNYVNLVPTDIDRPFHHISHNLLYDTLLKDISDVIEDNHSVEREIETSSGQMVVVKIDPYYNEVKVAKGCVVSITDISEVRKLKDYLSESYETLRATISTSLMSQKKIKVLLIDDEAADREQVKRHLSQAVHTEYLVDEADSIEKGGALIRENHYDVCLVDFYIAGQTAFEFIDSLKVAEKRNAFVLLSGYLDDGKVERAVDLGIYDYVDKHTMTPALLDRCIIHTLRHKKIEMYLASKMRSLGEKKVAEALA